MQHESNRCYTLSGIDEGKFSYIAVGCGGTADKNQKNVADAMYEKIARLQREGKPLPKFIALLGDNVYEHGVTKKDDEEGYRPYQEYFYDIYKRIYADFNIPFFNIIGNHGYNYETKTFLKSALPNFKEDEEWGPTRAQHLVEHSRQSTKTQDSVVEEKKGIDRSYTEEERAALNAGNEFPLSPADGQKVLPMYNLPFNYYKLQAGHQHFFFLDSNVYLSEWLALQKGMPGGDDQREGYLEKMMQAGNQAAWLQLQMKGLDPDDKVTFFQHHPILSRAKRGDPLVKSGLNRYMHTVEEREALRETFGVSTEDFDALTVNDLLLKAYQIQKFVGEGRRLRVHCAHAHAQYHVSDEALGIEQTTSGGGGGHLEHEFFPHRVSSEEFARQVDAVVATGLSRREAERLVDNNLLKVAQRTKFFADNYGFALHTVSTDGNGPNELEVLAMGAIEHEAGNKDAIYRFREEKNKMVPIFDEKESKDVLALRHALIRATQAYLSFLVRTRGAWKCPRFIPMLIWPYLCKFYLKVTSPFRSHSGRGREKAVQLQKELLKYSKFSKIELILLLQKNFGDFFHNYDKYTFVKAHLYQHSLYMFIEKACKEEYGVHLDEFVRHHIESKEERLDEFKGLEYSSLTPKVSLLEFIAGWKMLSYLQTKAEEHRVRGNDVWYHVYYLLGFWPWLFLVVIPASAMSLLTSLGALISEGIGLIADYAERDLKRDWKNGGLSLLPCFIWFLVCAICNVLYYSCRQIFSVQQAAEDWKNRAINTARAHVSEKWALRAGFAVKCLSYIVSALAIAALSAIILPYIAPLISTFSVVYWFQQLFHWKALAHLLKGVADLIAPLVIALDKPFSLSNLLPGKLDLPHPVQNAISMPEAGPMEVVAPTMFAVNSLAIAGAKYAERKLEREIHEKADNYFPEMKNQGVRA